MGRNKTLMLTQFFIFVGGFCQASSKWAGSYLLLMIGRLIGGVALGIIPTVAPIYISEVSPVKVRGALGALNHVATIVGCITSSTFGLSFIFGTPDYWPFS